MNKLILFHGTPDKIVVPTYGKGEEKHDYGQGFYCTENKELAKEWACQIKNDGYSNEYQLSLEGLNVMRLTGDEFNILNWLAVLLVHRKFDITSSVGNSAREYIIGHFMPDTTAVDVMIGYRADDSYFSFAEDFVNNTISLRDLNMAMHLGMLGEQVVLLSRRSFERVKFIGYEVADYREYYFKRAERDQGARTTYASHKKDLQQLMDDIFILDIMREGMGNDDARLQSALFK